MKISLSVIGKLGNYFDELKNLNIAVNDIAIPSIGNPKTPKNKRLDAWCNKMKKNINVLLEDGININDILLNVPLNQVINKNINEIDALISFLYDNNISKIIVIKGNGNMGKSNINIKDFLYEFKKRVKDSSIKIFVGLYPSHKLSWSKERIGKSSIFDYIHMQNQIKKIKNLDEYVDGYMTQITINGTKSAQWLNTMYLNTNKPIFLGLSAPTTKKLDIMHIRTQLNYICDDKRFLKDDTMFDIYLRVLSRPLKWYKILSTINLGILDMMWRFRLTRTSSFEKLIDDLKANIDPNNKIHIHFNSGGQSQDSALQYIRLLKKLI